MVINKQEKANMRKFVKPVTNEQQPVPFGPRPWNLKEEVAIYARQSTTKQTVENRESSEAQTKDQLQKVLAIGWTEDKITVFIEGDGKRGVSGRLRIDKRTGLNALVEGIYSGRFKFIFVINEGRLFRDETMIGPDTFIDACKRFDVVVVTDTYRYDFNRNPFDADQFRLQCQIAARFITDHVGMMNRMRDRVAKRGQYYGGGIGIGYILDANNRPTPYEPHAKIIREIFKRYRALGGNVAQLARELNANKYVFPPYEAGVKGPYTHLTVKNGGYGLTRAGLASILTNTQYIGYWSFKGQIRRDENRQPIINHPPIIEDLNDFWYAFNRLSPTTIDGEINTRRSPVVRYEQEGKIPSNALFKYGDNLLISPHGSVFVAKDRRKDGTVYEQYSISRKNTPDYMERKLARFNVKVLDTAFVGKMFEHLIAWKEAEEASQQTAQEINQTPRTIGALISEQLQQEAEEAQENGQTASIKAINGQLEQLRPKIAHHRRLIKGGYGLSDKELEDLGTELSKLQQTEQELEAAIKSIEKEAEEREESQQLVDEALEQWNSYTILQKRRVIKSVVTTVTISRVSPSWLMVEITWKGIGSMLPMTDIGYLWLPGAANVDWSQEEIDILREMYPYEHADTILERLPYRSWRAIIKYASGHSIKRQVFKSPSSQELRKLSLSDIVFMDQVGIDYQPLDRGQQCYIYWSDSETMLPMSEGAAEIQDLMTDDNDEVTSSPNSVPTSRPLSILLKSSPS
jgi:DNA invertase Pin-like site-specific DNA recombinase